MLRFLVLCVVLGSDGDKVPVKGVTTTASDYCGGALPPAAEMAKATATRADPGAHLRLYRGKVAQGEALEVKSDEKARFTLVLPPGEWCVVDGRRRILPGTKPAPGADPKCWAAAAVGCDLIWTIDRKDGKAPPDAVVHFQQGCDWSPPCGPNIAPPP